MKKLPWVNPASWLSGLTILDFSSLLPCPFAADLLAVLGARVIKIESPSRPDPARAFGTGLAYHEVNHRKELVWLDLKVDADRQKLYQLVEKADAGIEGYRPEVKQRLGIDFKTLQKYNPKFVLCSASGFHADGPRSHRAGHDLNFVALSGILDLTRGSDGKPVIPGVPLGDIAVAYTAALRLLAAVFAARQTGKGDHVQVTIEEALIDIQRPFLKEQISELKAGHGVTAGSTLATGQFPCYALYHLEGGTLAVGALEEKFWQAFCGVIERQDLIPQQFATGPQRDRTQAEVLKALSRRPFAAWAEAFARIDCCVEPVLTVADASRGIEGGL